MFKVCNRQILLRCTWTSWRHLLTFFLGNNQFLGSPVNRIKITGYWASRALVEDRDKSVTQRWGEFGRHMLFRFVLASTDLWFYWARFKQAVGLGKGMDDDIEASMQKMAER